MKNQINSMVFFAALISATSFFVSCSDDDDSGSKVNSSEIPSNAGVISEDLPSLRLVSVGYNEFYYDDKGNLTGIYADGDEYEIKGNKLEFVWDYYDEKEVISCSTNSNGLINKISVNWSDEDYDGEKEEGKGVATLTYNANSQIDKITLTGTNTDYYYGKKLVSTMSGTVTMTYDSKQRLTKVVYESSYKGSESGKSKETCVLNYDETYKNKYGQFTEKLADCTFEILDGGLSESLCYVGLLGKSSSMLPTSIDNETYESYEYDGEKHEYTDEWTYRCGPYEFNSDGTISYADGKRYSYTKVGNHHTKAVAPFAYNQKGEAKKLIGNLFKIHSRRTNK